MIWISIAITILFLVGAGILYKFFRNIRYRLFGTALTAVAVFIIGTGINIHDERTRIYLIFAGMLLLSVGCYMAVKKKITTVNIEGMIVVFCSAILFMITFLTYSDSKEELAWGGNQYGTLANGSYIYDGLVPKPIKGEQKFQSISGGNYHTLALDYSGQVWIWGWETVPNIQRYIPYKVNGLSNIVTINSGAWHSVALDCAGNVWTWGENGSGQLGDGTNLPRSEPGKVAGLSKIVEIAARGSSNLAIDTAGQVWAWGDNSYGQLGDGTKISRNLPVRVKEITNVKDIRCGSLFSIALTQDGNVWAWGNNTNGQLGNGGNTGSLVPVQSHIKNIKEISSGAYHSFAIDWSGAVWGWGLNDDGELGDGKNTASVRTPICIDNLAGYRKVNAGNFCSAGIDKEGKVTAWGRNNGSFLGVKDDQLENSNVPVMIVGLNNVRDVSISGASAYALEAYPVIPLLITLMTAVFLLILGLVLLIERSLYNVVQTKTKAVSL